MVITTTLHILDEDDFVGAAEFHDGVIDLWSVDGDVDTHMFAHGLGGEDLYAAILDRFAIELGVDKDVLCLTDADESEVIY